MRGLYADTTVAPPARVESRKTLPPRCVLYEGGIARSGSIRFGAYGDGARRRGHVFR